MRNDARGKLEQLNENESAEPDDIHLAIIRPKTGITVGSVCRLFQANIEKHEIPKDSEGAKV